MTPQTNEQERAYFSGGCFWCMEAAFDAIQGVTKTTSGYMGGTVKRPTYPQVSSGMTGHYETVEVTYNPSQITFEELLQAFWHNVDPLDGDGQFADRGQQYSTVIFHLNNAQRDLAKKSKQSIEKELGQVVQTQIVPASEFYPAEEYHQDYSKKNPLRYEFYKYGSGRPKRLKELWKRDTK